MILRPRVKHQSKKLLIPKDDEITINLKIVSLLKALLIVRAYMEYDWC